MADARVMRILGSRGSVSGGSLGRHSVSDGSLRYARAAGPGAGRFCFCKQYVY